MIGSVFSSFVRLLCSDWHPIRLCMLVGYPLFSFHHHHHRWQLPFLWSLLCVQTYVECLWFWLFLTFFLFAKFMRGRRLCFKPFFVPSSNWMLSLFGKHSLWCRDYGQTFLVNRLHLIFHFWKCVSVVCLRLDLVVVAQKFWIIIRLLTSMNFLFFLDMGFVSIASTGIWLYRQDRCCCVHSA